MRLFLVRHGQTDWNVLNLAQGSVDRPLDETGEAQSQAVARALANVPIERVLTSDLRRASDTARRIAEATGAELQVEPQLRERSFGTMEGQSYEALREFFNREAKGDAALRNHIRPPGGESFADLWTRLEGVMPIVRNGPETQVLVSHGGTCALLCAMILGEGLEDTVKYRFSNAGITEFDGKRIVRFDDVSHLEGLPLLVKRGDVAAH